MNTLLFALLTACSGPSEPATDAAVGTEAAVAAPPAGAFAGEWHREGQFNGGTLTFTNTTATTVDVALSVATGANIGEISGPATLAADKATLKIEGCEIGITRRGESYEVVESNCDDHHGAGAFFDGTFAPKKAPSEHPLVDSGALDEAHETALKAAAKGRFEHFNVFMMTTDETDEDGANAVVKSGGIRGLFTISEAIVMAGPDNKVWAAALNPENTEVTYVTNVPGDEKKLPKTIETWLKRFEGRTVVFGAP